MSLGYAPRSRPPRQSAGVASTRSRNASPACPLNSVLPIAASAVAMFSVALLAAWLPARRAAGVDPVNSLRYE
jgi:hypothetical protein